MTIALTRDVAALDIASRWMENFGSAVSRLDYTAAARLFQEDCHWRDVLAFTWHFKTVSGQSGIENLLERTGPRLRPSGFRIDRARAAPKYVERAGVEVVEAIFVFETTIGKASGVVRLVSSGKDAASAKAWHIFTGLDQLKFADSKAHAGEHGETAREFGGENWLDRRVRESKFEDRDPAVLVVGGGQAGLAIAARLRQVGVESLIIDKIKRVGDNWRDRYHALRLHNAAWCNHLPYMPYPASFPTYIPKDMLANWFESYVSAMELNYWTATDFVSGSYDHEAKRWEAVVRLDDGSTRVLRPRHIVLATGVSNSPYIPRLPGLEKFEGEIVHSGAYKEGQKWQGRNAVVIGSGTSGHDVAQDLHGHGARTTLVQRSPTTVTSLEPASQLLFKVFSEGMSTEDCDLINAAYPFPVLKDGYKVSTAQMREIDRDLIKGLEGVGFKIDFGEDDTGFQMKYLQKGGGYYLDVGCSQLLIDRSVELLQYEKITAITPDGLILEDGGMVPADLIVMATGYRSQEDLVRNLFGNEIVERVGKIWGFDEEGELHSMWKRTGQEGLWFTAGSLIQSRTYSKYLALQIKACEMGLIDPSLPADLARPWQVVA